MTETSSAAHQTLAARRTAPETGVDRAARDKEKQTADSRTAQGPETADAAASPRPPQTPCSADWCSRSHHRCASVAKHHKPANAAPPAPEERAPNRARRKRHPRNPAETNCPCLAEEIPAWRLHPAIHSPSANPETAR